MAKPKLFRWVCPKCGEGTLAPSRPRRDDVRRYCLGCSSETGRLVEREAPAIRKATEERARRKREAREKKERREREREAARFVVDELDTRRELRRLWRHAEALNRERVIRVGVVGALPRLHVVRHSHGPYSRLGSASPWRNEIRLNVGPGIGWASIADTLAHEVAHILVGYDAADNRWHGDEWKDVFALLVERAYGFKAYRVPAAYGGYKAKLAERFPDGPPYSRVREEAAA